MAKTAEIELKVHVGNPKECKERITGFAGKGTAISKDDAYWFTPAALRYFSGLRVRHETIGKSIKTLVTWKNKEKRGGIEVNDEHELEVSGGEDFEELLALLGLEKQTVKHKQGWSWRYGEITVELFEVSGYTNKLETSKLEVKKNPKKSFPAKPEQTKKIGWFLELEIIAAENSESTVTAARDKLFALLKKTGIGEEYLESRYYTELLEHQAGN